MEQFKLVLEIVGVVVLGLLGLASIAGALWWKFFRSKKEIAIHDTAMQTWKDIAEGRQAQVEALRQEVVGYKDALLESRQHLEDCQRKINEFGIQLLRLTARNARLETVVNSLRTQLDLKPLDFDDPDGR